MAASARRRGPDDPEFQELLATIKRGNCDENRLDAMAQKIRKNESLLNMVDRNGLTVMQNAILADCPGKMMRRMILRYGEAARQQVKGRLPLHMAIEAHTNPDILDVLLDAHPGAAQVPDIDSRLPAFLLLDSNWGHENPFPYRYVNVAVRLIQTYPKAASIRTGERTLLQVCLDQGLGEDVTLAVLQAYRCAAGVPRRDGVLPLHHAVELNLSIAVLAALLDAHPPALLTKMHTKVGDLLVIEHLVRSHRPQQGEDPSERRDFLFRQDRIECMLKGAPKSCEVKNPKAAAYARAALMGLVTKLQHGGGKADDGLDRRPLSSAKAPRETGAEALLQQRRLAKLWVKPFAGERAALMVDLDMQVDELRSLIQEREGTLASEQRLFFEGAELVDGHSLRHYRIKQESVVDMRFRLEYVHQALRNRVSEHLILEMLEIRPAAATELDRHGALPLHLALQERVDEPLLQRIFERNRAAVRQEVWGGRVGEYPLHSAIQRGYSPALIRELLALTQEGDWRKDGTYSPNHDFVINDDRNLRLPLLLALEQPRTSGFPPMGESEQCEVVHMLLGSKCDIQARDPRTGCSALDVAATKSERLFSLILLETLAVEPDAVEIAGVSGHCPLHVAVMGKAAKGVVNKLCEFRPDVLWMRDRDGRLPLHLACACGAQPDVVRTLLWHLPQSAREADARGKLPLQVAVASSPPPGVVFELVRKNRSLLTLRDRSGRTPLELAVKVNAPVWVVRELLQTDPNASKSVNLLDGNWPNNAAAIEAIRIVKELRKDKEQRRQAKKLRKQAPPRTATASSAQPRGEALADSSAASRKASHASSSPPQASTPQAAAEEPDEQSSPLGSWLGSFFW